MAIDIEDDHKFFIEVVCGIFITAAIAFGLWLFLTSI